MMVLDDGDMLVMAPMLRFMSLMWMLCHLWMVCLSRISRLPSALCSQCQAVRPGDGGAAAARCRKLWLRSGGDPECAGGEHSYPLEQIRG